MVALGIGCSVLPRPVAEDGPHPLRRRQRAPIAHRNLLAVRRRGGAVDPRLDRFLALALQASRRG
jgi:DNA-binding transcriptional LysR family regulator